MRLIKKSRTRRALGFYRSAYGIKPTYRVVVDGTALHAAYSRQLSLQERLPVLLNGKAELAVTRAVVRAAAPRAARPPDAVVIVTLLY